MKNKLERPVGTSFLGVLHLIVGPLTMVGAANATHSVPVAARFVIGIIEICLGIGLIQLRHWALLATIAFYALALLGSISHPRRGVIIFASVVIAYLFTPGARRAFAPHSVADPPATLPNS